MRSTPALCILSCFLAAAASVRSQQDRHAAPAAAVASPEGGLDPSLLTAPLSDSWPTYSGDYSGKRYSALSKINQSTVKHLTLAWVSRLAAGPVGAEDGRGRGAGGAVAGAAGAGSGAGRDGRGGAGTIIIGGEGTEFAGGSTNVRGSILEVDGILYATTPDNVWAIDARDGREIWHFVWRTKGGTHIGNRGVGMWHDYLYVETPDDYLVSLDARTGRERWHKVISDFSQQYFSTMAPIVAGNHVLVGTGDDLDAPGFLQSFDPETGDLQWKLYTVPMNPGDPGLETWADLDAARHGGGHAWNPGSYDPATHLYIFGTGNPTPAYTAQTRGEGDNLFTCALIAVNVETGKMAWHYQVSPHDTHDWDAAQTPVLVDAEFGGRPRKLVLAAERNGYFFVLDRVTGEHLLTTQFSKTVNWAKGLNDKGQPVRNPAKDFDIGGALVSSSNHGATNWPPPSFSPVTGLFYVPLVEVYAMYYLTETDPRGAMGLGGTEEIGVGSEGSYLAAIDYKTGRAAWKHRYPGPGGGGNGILTTAGRLVFAGDLSGNLVAYDAATGRILWHARLGRISNAPETYLLDGRQYLLVAAGDSLYAFTLME